MQEEVETLTNVLESPTRPLAAIVGGAKISTKLELLGNLLEKVDVLVIGGAMANTFLAALGKPVGKSLCEQDLIDLAGKISRSGECLGKDFIARMSSNLGGAARVIAHHKWRNLIQPFVKTVDAVR